MLGCHDFCGYYDWTFHYVGRDHGREAVKLLWADAIVKAQMHYTQAGVEQGLRGLYDVWVKTGEDERCDWTFTLDEAKNVLRCDMRECPSKGHLIGNDLYADEDYCDHCVGWMNPLLEQVGAEVVAHEHNHSGQCWMEMRIKGQPHESLAGRDGDITDDPRWARGYVERWEHGVKLPVLSEVGPETDPVEVLRAWFDGADRLAVLGRGPSAIDDWTQAQPMDAVIVTDPTYATQDVYAPQPRGVLIGDHPNQLEAVAKRFHATPADQRPLLMHAFLPGIPMYPFKDFDLPRPVPILPLLVRAGLYQHEPGGPYPTTGVFALLLAAALEKSVTVAGIDLYRHASGRRYAHGSALTESRQWPDRHSEACDMKHIADALKRVGDRATVHPLLGGLMADALAP